MIYTLDHLHFCYKIIFPLLPQNLIQLFIIISYLFFYLYLTLLHIILPDSSSSLLLFYFYPITRFKCWQRRWRNCNFVNHNFFHTSFCTALARRKSPRDFGKKVLPNHNLTAYGLNGAEDVTFLLLVKFWNHFLYCIHFLKLLMLYLWTWLLTRLSTRSKTTTNFARN